MCSENEQVELPVLTQLPENDVLHQDLADEQSEEENNDYDNNADESGDETPFAREDGDEEDEEEGPDLKRAPHRRKVNESEVSFHSREIPYIENLPAVPDHRIQKEADRIITEMRKKLKEVEDKKWRAEWNCEAHKEHNEKYKRELAEVKARVKELEEEKEQMEERFKWLEAKNK
ncbi:uncharacterized protein [Nicotiana sylvestris]|uniref:uncharacterized protein n=1 Tax=Nicotiana sylvestris TaxID=4096 RepID=UPI00388C84B0